jgi:excisionase family DNA binding protein
MSTDQEVAVSENANGDVLKVPQVAEMCGVDPKTVRRWIEDGFFPGAKRGLGKTSPYRIPRHEVEAFIEDRTKQRGVTPDDIA